MSDQGGSDQSNMGCLFGMSELIAAIGLWRWSDRQDAKAGAGKQEFLAAVANADRSATAWNGWVAQRGSPSGPVRDEDAVLTLMGFAFTREAAIAALESQGWAGRDMDERVTKALNSMPTLSSSQTSAQRWNRFVEEQTQPPAPSPSAPTVATYRPYVRKQLSGGFFRDVMDGWNAGSGKVRHDHEEPKAHDPRTVRDMRTARGIALGYPADYVCDECALIEDVAMPQPTTQPAEFKRCSACAAMVLSVSRFCSHCGHSFTQDRRR